MAIAVADTFDFRCQSQRLIYIDALRVTVIVFVIVHHAAQLMGQPAAFGPCMTASKADGSYHFILQMPPLAWD